MSALGTTTSSLDDSCPSAGITKGTTSGVLAIPGGFSEPPAEAFESDPLRKRETIELVSAYYQIDNAAVRRRLFDLAKVLAANSESASTSS